jgi:mercuric ion transport protein
MAQTANLASSIDVAIPREGPAGFGGPLAAGVLAAFDSSACCVGPLVLLMLGIGGAWVSHVTVLEPLRPWLAAAALMFLGLAYRRLYRRPRTCEPASVCADPLVRDRQRTFFWVVTVLLLALLSLPWLLPQTP